MQEVIKEIIRIDKLAFESQKRNEDELEGRKREYQNQMKTYKEQKLYKAERRANELYTQIVAQGEQTKRIEEERAKQSTLRIENKYLQVENQLIDRLFNELFIVEA